MAGPDREVEEIRLAGNRARLVLRIHREIQIPIDSVLPSRRRASSGRNTSRSSREGRPAQLAGGGQVANTLTPVNLDEMIRKLRRSGRRQEVLRFALFHLRDGGGEEGARDILRDVQATTASLADRRDGERTALRADRGEHRPALADLSDISSANKAGRPRDDRESPGFFRHAESETPDLVRKLERMSEQVSGVVGDNRENLKESIQNLKSASARLDNTLDFRREGDGQDRPRRGEPRQTRQRQTRPYLPQPNTLDGVNRYVRSTTRCDDPHSVGRYQPTPPTGVYLNLKIQPTADKYYLLGVVNDPRGKRTQSTTLVSIGRNPPIETKEVKFRGQVESSAFWRSGSPGSPSGRDHGVRGGAWGWSTTCEGPFSVGGTSSTSTVPITGRIEGYGNYDIVKTFHHGRCGRHH